MRQRAPLPQLALLPLILVPLTGGGSPAAAPAGGQEASCRAFVRKFYDWYVRQVNRERPASATDVALKLRPAYFSAPLRRGFAEDDKEKDRHPGELVGLDFDPFLNAQDIAQRYVVEKVTRKGQGYQVEVYGIWNGKRSKVPDVVPELVPGGRAGWTFVNFHYPSKEKNWPTTHLLNVLKELRAEQKKGFR